MEQDPRELGPVMHRVLNEWEVQDAMRLEMQEILDLTESDNLRGNLGKTYPEMVIKLSHED